MENNIWLRRFSKFTSASTLFLIFAGGMVTSTQSGLSVPDWPLSYGMLFPPMVGGVFYEHGHRMVATCVGLFTLCLAIWLGLKEQRKWIKVLGFSALFAVIAQGVLGGITVLYFLPTPVSVAHGVLAQTFFILTIVIAYSLSLEREQRKHLGYKNRPNITYFTASFVFIIYVQLILGAIMRHTGSGLAIYDFPKMAGYWWPPYNETMLIKVNHWRFENNLDPVNMQQVIFHIAHRIGALCVFIAVIVLNVIGLRFFKQTKKIVNLIFLINFIVTVQILLGIATVLLLKAPIITSLHVVTGALLLGASTLLLLRIAPLSFKEFNGPLSRSKS